VIGVDAGTSAVKWFDGKSYGTGFPKGKGIITGISSKSVFVKKAVYPVCRGRHLKELILNDVSADLGLPPEELGIAFCPAGRKGKGCEFLVFVERAENLKKSRLENSAILTVDVVGTANCALLTHADTACIVDAGKAKTAILELEGGRLKGVEIVRAGFEALLKKPDLLLNSGKLSSCGEVLLVGGGALSPDFRKLLSKVAKVKVPVLEPFGEETPLYYGAFGLYHFRRANCRATFARHSLLQFRTLTENRKRLIASGVLTAVGVASLAGAYTASIVESRKTYFAVKERYSRMVEKVLGTKVVAPEEQLSLAESRFLKLRRLLMADKPSILHYLSLISQAVPEGITVTELDGSLATGVFRVQGFAEKEEALTVFVENLKKHFGGVDISSSRSSGEKLHFVVTLKGR